MPTRSNSTNFLKNSKFRLLTSIATLAFAVLSSNTAAHATNYTWKGSATGLLTTATNWLPLGIPTATDNVVVTTNSILTVTSNLTVSQLTLGPGSLVQGVGAITVTDRFSSQDASVVGLGTLTIGPKATADLSSASSTLSLLKNNKILKPLYNAGTINLASGYLVLGADFLNDTGSTLNIGGDGCVSWNSQFAPLLENRGTIVKTGADKSCISTDFINSGIIRSMEGTLDVGDYFTQTSGTISMDGGNLSADSPLTISGGKLAGTGIVYGDVINNGNGHVAPGHSPGDITINGNYTQTGNGSLDIEIGGTTAGTQYDHLTVNGNSTLGGMLNIMQYNGYTPVEGSSFEILDYYSNAGSFSTVNFQFPNTPLVFSTDLTPMYLVATATKPDGSLPTTTVTSPTAGSANTTLTSATGTAADSNGIKSVTVQLYRYGNASTAPGFWSGGTTWSTSYTATANERSATGTTDWSLSLPTLAYGEYSLRPTAKDATGKASLSDSTHFFKTAGSSSITLSTATASAANDCIQLKFTGALDSKYAVDATRFDVTRTTGGQPISIQSIAYNASTNTVSLNVLDGVLKAGDKITINVNNMFDSTGKILAKQTGKPNTS